MWLLGMARGAGLTAEWLQGWQASDLALNWGSLERSLGVWGDRVSGRAGTPAYLHVFFLNAENQD